MKNKDIRWIQRFHNFTKAFSQLRDAVTLAQQRPLSSLERQGLIQAFKYTHELAWNTLKDLLEARGHQRIYGSRDATRSAFQLGIVDNGDAGMDMIKSRNQTTHTYNEGTAAEILSAIVHSYFAEFVNLQGNLSKLEAEELLK